MHDSRLEVGVCLYYEDYLLDAVLRLLYCAPVVTGWTLPSKRSDGADACTHNNGRVRACAAS
jgi:hypothetical protein